MWQRTPRRFCPRRLEPFPAHELLRHGRRHASQQDQLRHLFRLAAMTGARTAGLTEP